MWLQFVSSRISSDLSNSLRQTAQVTASRSSDLSANWPYSITGRHLLIISAETLEAASTECSGRSAHVTSDSRKSANPTYLRNQHMPFLIVDSKNTALNSIWEIMTPEYSAGNPITNPHQQPLLRFLFSNSSPHAKTGPKFIEPKSHAGKKSNYDEISLGSPESSQRERV